MHFVLKLKPAVCIHNRYFFSLWNKIKIKWSCFWSIAIIQNNCEKVFFSLFYAIIIDAIIYVIFIAIDFVTRLNLKRNTVFCIEARKVKFTFNLPSTAAAASTFTHSTSPLLCYYLKRTQKSLHVCKNANCTKHYIWYLKLSWLVFFKCFGYFSTSLSLMFARLLTHYS